MAPLGQNTNALNSPKKPATAKKGFLTRAFSAGSKRTSKSSTKEAIIRSYTEAMLGGDMTSYFTDDATFSPPGATLPISAVSGMMSAMVKAFPHWESKVVKVEEQADGTCKAYTQQRIGVMKADLPALGPFPAVKLADAAARIKAVPTILPIEVGIVTFNPEGTKVTSVDYSAAAIDETLDATTMDLKSPVGFPCLFELMGVELPEPPSAPTFFSVVHTFVEGKAEGFWAEISSMTDAQQQAMHAKWHEMGYHNHSFMPSSPTGVVNCLWECKPGTSLESFQAFIDGPEGPAEGVFTNACYKVMDGAVLPTSYFNEPPPPPTMPSTGNFFWVYHRFKEGAAEQFWGMLSSMGPDELAAMGKKHHDRGFHNHSFAPCAVEGPCICIWESEEPVDAETFRQFIDGPDGPGGGAVFDNDVHLAMAGAALPPAYYPQPSVVHHRINTIPIVKGAMPKIIEVAQSAAFKAQVAAFAGLIDVDVLSVDEATMMSHSRWQSAAYAKAAAAALGAVLGGALKPFITGPPSPVFGQSVWSVEGSASRGVSGAPAVRMSKLSLKEGALNALLDDVRNLEEDFKALEGLVCVDALQTDASTILVAAQYASMAALDAAAPKIGPVMKAMAPHLAAPPAISAGTVAWSLDVAAVTEQARRQKNMERVQHLVGEFMAGRPEGYMAGVADDIKGSILGGLLPGAEAVANKEQFGKLMGSMDQFLEVKKFAPSHWRAVGDDVLFNVDWTFVWKATGETIDTAALVRKVVRDGLICEKYHMICPELIERLTGKAAPHSQAPVERVQALLVEYGAGRPEGYMAGVADDFTFDVLGGLIPGAVGTKKAAFGALMGSMGEYMEVSKFEPYNFRAMPNSDMIFNVDWTFVWKPTGETVNTTAICRKVLKEVDGALMLCEKYHMVDATCIVPDSSSPEAFIKSWLADYAVAAKENDATKFDDMWAKYWAPQAVVIRPSGNPMDHATWRSMVTSADIVFESSECVSFDSCTLIAGGKVAAVTFTLHDRFTFKGVANDDIAKYSATLELSEEGTWKMVHAHRATGQTPA